ncbi:MAG: FimV/HubP family polar landmark protein [Leptothrix sp. (in: b-proteobacteria)]
MAVQSSIGEALRAEIDVTSLTPEEAANLRVRVAAPDAYRVAGIDYNPVLPATAITLQRRADGTPYLQISSDASVQEPFVDLILELSWSSGRLLREYTLLFDPPSGKAAPVTQVPPVAVAAPKSAPEVSAAPRAELAPAAVPIPAPETSGQSRAAAPAAAVTPTAATGKEYAVRHGDTLRKIAGNVPVTGVSLDQLVVSLYRGNPQAFSGNNMNRLRSGVVLNLPSEADVAAVDSREARKLIQAQSADFDAYRHRLAAAVPQAAEPTAPARQASGKVQSEIQDKKQSAATAPDRLTLDKGKAKGTAASAPAVEDKLAKERAQKEAAARVKELNRNVEELKKLQAASSATAPAASAGSMATAPPAVASAPAAGGLAIASAPVVAASMPPLPVVSAASEAASAPVLAAASAPAPTPAAVPANPPTHDEEPSLIDSLAENPLVLPGAGLVLAILAGLGWYRLRNKNKEEGGVTSFLESRLQPDSFFGASGGQRIDTRDAAGTPSSMSYSLSQIDAIGDVDPVAEADVYLAYGRDLQAEEILKEAMRATPDRLAIRTKLLEVYAKRRDIKGFELLAGELYGLTAGQGEEWLKTQELGRSIDADNPLYEPGGAPHAGGEPTGSGVEPLGASTMPQSVVPSPSRFEHSVPSLLDLNTPDNRADNGSIDLDISVPGAMDAAPSRPPSFSTSGFGNKFVNSRPSPADSGHSVDFNLQDFVSSKPGMLQAPRSDSPMDLGGISLDLDMPQISDPSGPGTASTPFDLSQDDDADPLARKIELAEEFRQIGDLEGARDLLQEVIERADGALKSRAQAMLDNLS